MTDEMKSEEIFLFIGLSAIGTGCGFIWGGVHIGALFGAGAGFISIFVSRKLSKK